MDLNQGKPNISGLTSSQTLPAKTSLEQLRQWGWTVATASAPGTTELVKNGNVLRFDNSNGKAVYINNQALNTNGYATEKLTITNPGSVAEVFPGGVANPFSAGTSPQAQPYQSTLSRQGGPDFNHDGKVTPDEAKYAAGIVDLNKSTDSGSAATASLGGPDYNHDGKISQDEATYWGKTADLNKNNTSYSAGSINDGYAPAAFSPGMNPPGTGIATKPVAASGNTASAGGGVTATYGQWAMSPGDPKFVERMVKFSDGTSVKQFGYKNNQGKWEATSVDTELPAGVKLDMTAPPASLGSAPSAGGGLVNALPDGTKPIATGGNPVATPATNPPSGNPGTGNPLTNDAPPTGFTGPSKPLEPPRVNTQQPTRPVVGATPGGTAPSMSAIASPIAPPSPGATPGGASMAPSSSSAPAVRSTTSATPPPTKPQKPAAASPIISAGDFAGIGSVYTPVQAPKPVAAPKPAAPAPPKAPVIPTPTAASVMTPSQTNSVAAALSGSYVPQAHNEPATPPVTPTVGITEIPGIPKSTNQFFSPTFTPPTPDFKDAGNKFTFGHGRME